MIIGDELGWIIAAIGVVALIAGVVGAVLLSGSTRFVALGAGVTLFLVAGIITYLRRD